MKGIARFTVFTMCSVGIGLCAWRVLESLVGVGVASWPILIIGPAAWLLTAWLVGVATEGCE